MTEVLLTLKEVGQIDSILKEFDNISNGKAVYSKNQIYKTFNQFKKLNNYDDLMMQEEKRKYMTGKRKLDLFVRYVMKRNLCNYDTMLLLTGVKGAGKSSTGIQLIRRWCKLLGIQFNPARHIAYNNADMMDRIEKLKPFEPLLADEAIRFATSEDWNKSENKELKKKLGEVRTKHLFFILCFPLEPNKLEKTYLNSYVNYWIDLYDRGKGALFVKDMNPGKDAWNLKAFDKLGSWSEFATSQQIEDKLKKHPNFWETIRIPKVPKEVYEKYLAVRESNVYEDDVVMKAMSKNDVYKAIMVLMLKEIVVKDGSLSYVRILKAIDNKFDIQINKQELNAIMKDCKDLVKMYKAQGGK